MLTVTLTSWSWTSEPLMNRTRNEYVPAAIVRGESMVSVVDVAVPLSVVDERESVASNGANLSTVTATGPAKPPTRVIL